MPRSNSSFGVADGGKVVSAALAPGARGGGGSAGRIARRRCWRDRAARPAPRPPGAPTGAFGRHRELAAAERARRAGGIRILAGIEGIAAAPAWRRRQPAAAPGRSAPARRSAAAHSPAAAWRLPIGGGIRAAASAGCRGDVGLGDGGRTAGRGLRAALQRPQALLELPVAVLQLLVLAGELPQLILKLLDPHFRIGIVGLRAKPATASDQRQHRGERRGAGNSDEIWMTFWPDDEIGVTSKAETH